MTQSVQYCGGSDDGGTVLIVVEYRDFATFAQFAFDIEALRRFDVFEVDTTESRFQRSDDVYQFLRVFFIDFDIEYINTGEFFEQYAFAFHHGFTGQCADIAQAQHCCTVGNHGNQIAFGSVFVGSLRIGMDFHTRSGYARRERRFCPARGIRGTAGRLLSMSFPCINPVVRKKFESDCPKHFRDIGLRAVRRYFPRFLPCNCV